MSERGSFDGGVCGFGLAWVGLCKSPRVAGSARCAKHGGIKCCSCGQPATRECDHTGGFVCGFPLCDGCEHSAPPDDNPGMFFMGGGHKPTAEARASWEAARERAEARRLG